MNPSDELLIWRYVEGDCTPQEEQAVAAKLAADPSFRAAWAERRALHSNLQKIEAEEPSLRFVQNVMDLLPRTIQIEPLISRPVLVRWLSVATVLTALIGVITLKLGAAGPGEAAPPVYLKSFTDLMATLPQQIFVVTAALGLGFLLLNWLDRRLRERMG